MHLNILTLLLASLTASSVYAIPNPIVAAEPDKVLRSPAPQQSGCAPAGAYICVGNSIVSISSHISRLQVHHLLSSPCFKFPHLIMKLNYDPGCG